MEPIRDPGLPPRRGYLALMLQAHLPFVRHPEHDEFLEERWLFEAITEAYIPLLEVLGGLVQDRVPHRLTVSLSPPLLNMLSDRLLQARYVRHLEKLIAFAEEEIDRTRDERPFQRLALFYRDSFRHARRIFLDVYEGNLLQGFRRLQEAGSIEVVASAATHGHLPLLAQTPSSVRAQVALGLAEHRRVFGEAARGFWLPEAAFHPDLDEILAQNGVRYCIVDTHGVLNARPGPVFGVYAPLVTPAGVVVFARDAESSTQVWSAQHGYPGDFDYRDFYRDAGFDLAEERVRSFLPPGGARVATGVKYHRITGPGREKEPYVPEWARGKVEAHASNFVASRARQIEGLAARMDHPPIVVAPFDAELFGHWWFEGPQWLDVLLRKTAYEQDSFATVSLGDYLDRHPVAQEAMPAASSWGEGGYNAVWLSGENDWIYRHLDAAARRMERLATAHGEATGLTLRALNQAGRELLLAQSSDWAFIMSRGTVVNYAVERTRSHLSRFHRLAEQLDTGHLDERWIAAIEACDSIFPALDYRIFR